MRKKRRRRTFTDLTGEVFGRLTVLTTSRVKWAGVRRTIVECRCSCGKTWVGRSDHLAVGLTQSCGCLLQESTKERSTKHGQADTPAYRSWKSMKSRCLNPKCKEYKNYGGRGILVCEDWLTFTNFYKDMGDRPKGLTLDRVNNDGNYCKSNCRWATWYQQANNKRKRKPYTAKLGF